MLAYLISVLNAEYHVTPVHLGEQVVVEEGAEATDMHHAGRTRGVADTNAILANVIRAELLEGHLADRAIIHIDLCLNVRPSHFSAEVAHNWSHTSYCRCEKSSGTSC